MPYDSSRMANFGRDASQAYTRYHKAQDRMVNEIELALKEKVSPTKVAHDLMGRCSGRSEMVQLMTILRALTELEKIPPSIMAQFQTEKGIRPRRL